MFESENKSALDRVRKSLYSREEGPESAPRHVIHGHKQDRVRNSWDVPASDDMTIGLSQKVEDGALDPKITVMPHIDTMSTGSKKGYKIAFIGATLFFLIALAVAAYSLLGGRNFISVQNVDIQINGPVSVSAGESFSLNVSVFNKNSAEIQIVDLISEYPEGSKDPADPTKDVSRLRQSLGTIAPQGVAQKTLNAIVFGEEGEEKIVKFTVEYRTANSNAVFLKQKEYVFKLASSPLLVYIGASEKVLSNQNTPTSITISSNATEPVRDVMLELEYPFGFVFSSADPAPSYGNNIWRIGDLAPGAKRVITLQGLIQGEDSEERTLHATLGIQSTLNEREIATKIVSRSHTFLLEKPVLGLDLALDGVRVGDLAVEPGKSVRAEIIWSNNGANRITSGRIEAKLSGNALDRNSINVSDGYYDSRIDTIIWETGRNEDLDSIVAGESNRVSFTFSALRAVTGQAVLNPIITIQVKGTGKRVDEAGTSQTLTTLISRSARLVSDLAVSSRLLYSQGPISNSGPIPPRADVGTTYTVLWTVTNTSNSIKDAVVTATVPPYVTWTGTIIPNTANITFDAATGNITWKAGDVGQGADVGTGAKQVAFQLAVVPNVNQVGLVPNVMGQSTITGTDTFSGVTVKNTAQPLTTFIRTDLNYKPGDEIVQPQP